MIDTKIVDNSASSTGYATNKHACPNTNDKVFLLSTTEVSNANYSFTSNSKRRKWQSDYALSQGVHKDNTSNTSMWWVRSPNDYYTHWARTVYHDGHLNVDDGVNHTYYGIVPALWIIL
jgi:hypothetical protein